jgi:hypothetical protein
MALVRFAALVPALLAATVAAAAPARPAPPAAEAQLEAWWAEMEKGEPEATRALLKFAERPEETIAFLKPRLKALTIEARRVRELLADLGSDKDEVWKAAYSELEYFDPRLVIDLPTLMNDVTESPARQRMVEILSGRTRGSLAGKEIKLLTLGKGDGYNFSAEGTWWAEHLVARLNRSAWGNAKMKWTRATRAVALLEHFGTPEAVALLKSLATGHADAQPTVQAKAALERLAKKDR